MFAAAVTAGFFGIPEPAAAETKLIRLPPRVLAFDPESAGSRTLAKDQALWSIPLRWPKAAILEQAIQLGADDRRTNLNVGDVLAETRLQFDDPSLAGAVSFCVARLAEPSKVTTALIGGLLARSLTDGQFCIVDREGDGTADMSVLINAGSPTARTPVRITPLRYRSDVGVEVGKGDYARLVYRGGQKFELEFYEQESKRRYDTFTTTTNLGKEAYSSFIRRTKTANGSQFFVTPGGTLNLRSFDEATGSITIDWDARTRFKLIPVPDDVQTRVRFY
jgi:hypothetical protein